MINELKSKSDKVYLTKKFLTPKQCDKFINMVKDLKLPVNANFKNEYRPYWEYRTKDITHNPIVKKIGKFWQKHLGYSLSVHQAQIQIWIPNSYSTLHTHDEKDRGRENTHFNSLLYLNDVKEGGEFITENGIKIKPKTGTLTLFDGRNIKHGINKVKHYNRYTIIIWWSL
tara:strand:- start:63 stop:575 length:513 start_codon:yes stop_codon:yes gene_type:complete